MSTTLIFAAMAIYVLGFFALAWWSERGLAADVPRLGPMVWGLSIAVYTSSSIYFSFIGTSARGGTASLTPYLGPVLVFALMFPLVLRIAKIVKRENIVSIADFLSSRYGKSRVLATLVATFAMLGSIPFLAQQLRGMSMALSAVTQTHDSSLVALVLALVLAGFVIMFGARHPTLTEHNRGLMRVIALESLLKLLMLATVAVVSTAVLIRGFGDVSLTDRLANFVKPPRFDESLLLGLTVGIAGILCAPRQFFTGFVQLEKIADLKKGRWIVLAYFVGVTLLVIPIAMAGNALFQGQDADMYVLKISQQTGGALLAIPVLLGAFSAIAAPIMAETLALSGMISNELILPVFARTRYGKTSVNIGNAIVNFRRVTICALLLLGWAYATWMRPGISLGSMGYTTSAGILQFLPILIGGLFWRRGHAAGAIAGLVGGFAIWLLVFAAPQFLGDFGIRDLLSFSFPGLRGATSNVAFSLGVNTVLYVAVSLLVKPRLIDRIQAAAFIDPPSEARLAQRKLEVRGTVRDLKNLLEQFLGRDAAIREFANLEKNGLGPYRDKDSLDFAVVRATERILAGVIGASLSRRVMGWQLARSRWEATDILRVLDDAAEAVQFNRGLLQTTLDHVGQGICVFDRNGRMMAWNQRYIDLIGFPAGFIHLGQSIDHIIQFGASREETQKLVDLWMTQIRLGLPHDSERKIPGGPTLKILGSPMPGGRYVVSYTDVTELRQAASELRQANERLEDNVRERTRELTIAIAHLAEAKSRAERATNSQARFLAAASHDLLQPLHAARLFMGALREELPQIGSGAHELTNNADLSIEYADRLLRALLNLSRLEVGGVKPEVRAVNVNALLNELRREFEPVATDQKLTLRIVPTSAWALSDSDLLRSVLQNLIGNALRYTRTGAVLVGCRQDRDGVRFEIRDSGPGIPEDALTYIFEEFSRLPGSNETGLGAGLGLAIAERICQLLNHRLTVRSRVGAGSIFSVTVPGAQAQPVAPPTSIPGSLPPGLRILCVENDRAVLQSMEALLARWRAYVSTAASMSEAMALEGYWDVVLADYHLEGDDNGLDLIEKLSGRAGILALVTADQSEEMLARAALLGIEVIRKPVAPASLRTFLSRAWRAGAAAE